MGAALIFLVVFGAFGWFVYRAYRFIAWNSGYLSPEFHRVTREISFTRYFTRFPPLLGLVLAAETFVIWSLTLQTRFPDRWALVAVVLVSILMTFLVGAMLTLEWQFWTLTDGVSVTFDPADSSIEVEWLGRYVRITPETITCVEIHEGHFYSKLMRMYGYCDFFLHDGQIVRLNNLFLAEHEFMQKHFGTVPLQVFTYRLPWKITAPVIRRAEVA
jgi:hypothetical protein